MLCCARVRFLKTVNEINSSAEFVCVPLDSGLDPESTVLAYFSLRLFNSRFSLLLVKKTESSLSDNR